MNNEHVHMQEKRFHKLLLFSQRSCVVQSTTTRTHKYFFRYVRLHIFKLLLLGQVPFFAFKVFQKCPHSLVRFRVVIVGTSCPRSQRTVPTVQFTRQFQLILLFYPCQIKPAVIIFYYPTILVYVQQIQKFLTRL